MSFLNPQFLWVLPAAVLPILLHLLNKRPPRRVMFSHIAWLRNVHESMMPKKRFREILLMIVRTLLMMAIVFFFARPVVHRAGFLTGAANESMVLLVDVSASMTAVDAGREALDWAKERLQQALRKIPLSVKVGIVIFSDQVEQELAPTDERSRITAALQNAKATSRGTDVLPALKLGARMLANQPNGRKTLVIVSDLAQNGWNAAKQVDGKIEGVGPDVRVLLWDAVGRVPNAGVSDANLALSEEGLLKGVARFHRSGSETPKPTWSLQLNERVVSQGEESEEVALKAQLPEGGFYSGKLAMTPDAASFDDTYYIAGRVPKGFKLLIVDGESGLAPSDSETYYLRSALESPRDPRVESIDVVRPELMSKTDVSKYDAVVLANVPDGAIDAIKESDLLAWVEKGGGLFLSAGSKWPKPPKVPLRVFRSSAWNNGKVAVSAPVENAPFLSALSKLADFQWNQISVTQYLVLEKEAANTPVLSLDNGDPILVRKQFGKGFVLCLTTSLDRAWTNFPAKPVFAPLMRELMAALADPLREQTALQGVVGVPVKFRVPAGVKSVSVIAPNGVVSGGNVSNDGMLEWPAPSLAGLYQVKTDRRETDFSFAVNVPRLDLEGDLTRLSEKDARRIFPESPVDYVSASANKTEALVAALQGRDLTNPVLASLFILFGFETVLGFVLRRTGEK